MNDKDTSRAAPSPSPSVPHATSTILSGHQGPVLCLDYNCGDKSFGCLISGSEDFTARIWDLRSPGGRGGSGSRSAPVERPANSSSGSAPGRLRASMCIKTTSDVVSVAFASSCARSGAASSQLSPLTGHLARDFSVFLSSNNSIWEYDLRRAASPVVVLSQDDESCPPFLTADDEVNQIALNQQKGIAAAVDDAGSLSVWSLETPQHNHQKQIQSASVPDTIMTTVSLRPHTPKAAQAVSGSTDGCIRLWDVGFGRGRKLRLLDAVDMNAVSNNDVYSSSSNQICNPPMVHHVAFSPSGRLLAAALGDGSISLTKVDTRSFGNTTRLSDAHGGPVASVVFGSWNDERSSSRVDAADRLLCSAGNDGAIVYWDLGTNLCGRKTLLPVEDFFLRVQLRSHPPPSTYHNDAADSAVAEGEPRSLFAVQHGAKPNWMVSSRSSDPLFPSTLFVADTSNQVTAYTIPLSS